MTEETPKRPYPNLKWYPDSNNKLTIREAEAGLNNCLAEIKRLRGVLREIIQIATPDHEEARHKAIKIARTALGEKTDDPV
jgi:hypothetical protein